ncbi:MAG: hypothetical protein JWM35_868 [Verrucomicrobia bacterium]|nr:hypothetical protein [Verrucomicrobiota bacterium]
MNPMLGITLSRRALVLGLVFTAAGCNHLTPTAQTQGRIQEKPTLYQSLTEQQQADILGGAIERGNTADMVYLALGKPAKVVTSADGVKAMWVYVEYYSNKSLVSSSFNNPNNAHYSPGVAGENTPFHGGANDPAWQKPMGWSPPNVASSQTQGLAPMQWLDVPEMKSKTVYVFFVRGHVAEIKLEGDSSDQRTAAPNVASLTK